MEKADVKVKVKKDGGMVKHDLKTYYPEDVLYVTKKEAEGLVRAGAVEIVAIGTTRGNAETRPTES